MLRANRAWTSNYCFASHHRSVLWISRSTYVAKKSTKDKKGTPMIPALKKKNGPKHYLREDPFPADKTEFAKHQKVLDIEKATTLTGSNPYEPIAESLDQIAESIGLEDPLPEPTDRVVSKTQKTKEAWQKKQKPKLEQQEEQLDQMGHSVEQVTKIALSKRKPFDPSRLQVDFNPSNPTSFTFDEELSERIAFMNTHPDLVPPVPNIEDLQTQVQQASDDKSKIRQVIYPLKELHDASVLDTSYVAKMMETLESEHQAKFGVPDTLYDSEEDKKHQTPYQKQVQEEIDMKMRDFQEKAIELDPIMFGFSGDTKEFNHEDLDREQTKEAKARMEKMGKTLKQNIAKKKAQEKEDEEDPPMDRFPGEDTDAPHTLVVDVPLTQIELELKEEQRQRRKEREELMKMDDNERGDMYITDIEEVNDEDDTPRDRLRAKVKQDLDEHLSQNSLQNPDISDKIEFVDGTLLVDGVSVPHVSRAFIDELYGRMPYRERKRLEKRMMSEELRLKRLQRKRSQSRRYIYDGDSQYTRRQLQISELVRNYVEKTLSIDQFRGLHQYAITIDHVTINRDLSAASVFWTSDGHKAKEAIKALAESKSQIRKYFAKFTSRLRISPDLKFVRLEGVADVLKTQTEIEMATRECERNFGQKAASKLNEELKFLQDPLPADIRQEYELDKLDDGTLTGKLKVDFHEFRVKEILLHEKERKARQEKRHKQQAKALLKSSNINLHEMYQNEDRNENEYFRHLSFRHEVDSLEPQRQEQKRIRELLDDESIPEPTNKYIFDYSSEEEKFDPRYPKDILPYDSEMRDAEEAAEAKKYGTYDLTPEQEEQRRREKEDAKFEEDQILPHLDSDAYDTE